MTENTMLPFEWPVQVDIEEEPPQQGRENRPRLGLEQRMGTEG